MKARTRICTLLCALSLTATALSQPIDLRGPAPREGEWLRTTSHVETEEGVLNMAMQGQKIEGKIQTQTDNVTLLEYLDVSDGQVEQARMTTEKNVNNTKMTIFGQEQEQAQGQEVEGVTMTMTRTDDGWDTELGGTPVPQAVAEVLEQAGYVDPASLYPTDPVSVGDSWEVGGQKLGSLMAAAGLPGSSVDGSSSFTLKEVRVIEGNRTAVIDYEVNMTVKVEMAMPGMDMVVVTDLVGKGQILRRLDNYTDHNTLEGSMVIQTEMSQGGQPMMVMDTSMPVRYTVQTQRSGGDADQALDDAQDALDQIENQPALPRK